MHNSDSHDVALTVGTFDGIHLGHQALLSETQRIAGRRGLTSAAYTYRIPPKRYFTGSWPQLLLPPEEKIRALNRYVQDVVVHDFEEVKDYSPAKFVEEVLVRELQVNAIIVGTDWRFGADRTGSLDELYTLAKDRFTIHPQEQVKKNGRIISSTWIRRELQQGNVKLVRGLLGHPPMIYGKVVSGDKIGRNIGFPTANLKVDKRVVTPYAGSYAAIVTVSDKCYPGVVYVGAKPTFNKAKTRVEVHIIDFDNDIYGENVELELIRFISSSKRYRNKAELKRAIEGIVERARDVLAKEIQVDG
ncbi:riboflavin biosynthesis protein RibF [Candidatus Bipolaricaulota bacterium]|nr:riboflavin biosynthesis protein RibF [Candidatus Bipolaricaulota bacterium]